MNQHPSLAGSVSRPFFVLYSCCPLDAHKICDNPNMVRRTHEQTTANPTGTTFQFVCFYRALKPRAPPLSGNATLSSRSKRCTIAVNISTQLRRDQGTSFFCAVSTATCWHVDHLKTALCSPRKAQTVHSTAERSPEIWANTTLPLSPSTSTRKRCLGRYT